MSLAPSASLITKSFSLHVSPLHPKLYHPQSLPFGNALYTHSKLLNLVLRGCNPAGNFQRCFHWVLPNASFQHNRQPACEPKGDSEVYGIPCHSAGWFPASLSYTWPQLSRWYKAKVSLSLLLALTLRILNSILVNTDMCRAFISASCVHYVDKSIPSWKITTTLIPFPQIILCEFQKHACLKSAMEKMCI